MKVLDTLRDLFRGLGILFLVVVTGTIGYRLIEGWSILDSLYMTVTTITTVGYTEVHPLSTGGRIFSIFLILGGVGTAFYILTSLVQYTIEGELGIRIGRQRMESKIRRLNNHFILCGYGRVGQAIANILTQQEAKFVVIDRDIESINKAQDAGYLTIHSDATIDEALKQSRIDSARGIIIALGDDASNIYATLVAKELNAKIPLVARANSEDAERKLRQAGADRIVAPEAIGGARMARLALRPQSVEFIETVLFGREKQLLVEEIEAAEGSPLIGSTIKDIEEQFTGIRIMALKQKNGALIPNPAPQSIVEKGSSLIAFGTSEQLKSIEECCQSGRTRTQPAKKPAATK
jgi:voltage-gated potassium channel